jgi:hypothetical protein
MLDLSDEEIAALLVGLDRIIDGDRFALSPRIRILTGIRDKLQTPPVREPLSEPKRYEPPAKRRYRRHER